MTATTTDQTEAEHAVAQAEQEASEAEQLLAALEERVRDGDDAVTPTQLADARELGRFAKLRAEAARRKAERTAQAAADKQRAAHLAQATAITAPGGPLDAGALAVQYAAARDAVRAFVAASEAYNAAITEAAELLAAADVPDSANLPHPEVGVMARWGTKAIRLADGTSLYPTGTGLRLAVLLADLDHEIRGIPTGDYQPPFLREPLITQADRGRDAKPQLHLMEAELGGGGA
ncbi:hypothetical protein ACIBL5_14815 [Streptomyces sp. NPDC050516]|uniref:hypothetical protein n=1 Tax=Streptomyces sp. NPDC050516 TaxID=3365621 RepID=UPI0037B22D1B